MAVEQERDGSNNPLVSYTRGVDLSGSMGGAGGIGGLLARTDTNGNSYYHADGNGNITAMVNSSGTVVAKYLYDSFGNLINKRGILADANTYRFSSKELDQRSGLYYYGYRYYEPNLQRWMNRDPIEECGGINLYGYAGNNPVNWIDPLGFALFPSAFPDSQPTTSPNDPFSPNNIFAPSDSYSGSYTPSDDNGGISYGGSDEYSMGSYIPDTQPDYGAMIDLALLAAMAIPSDGADLALVPGVAANARRCTVIGRMKDLERFADNPAIDTWVKSGRIPRIGDKPVLWEENQAWLDARIARGDSFGIATDPATLPPVVDGFIQGQANGYFTAREFSYLQRRGVLIITMH